MKHNYLFSRKGNAFVWESEWVRLEYSNPDITLLGDGKCHKPEDILYFYYDVKIFAKRWYNNRYKWCKVAKVRTHDFPAMECLLDIVKEFLGRKEPDEHWSQFPWGNQTKFYHITDCTNAMRTEDFYELTKNILPAYNKEWYNLYIGCRQGELRDTIGIRLTDLKKDDIIQLKRCLEKFLKFSIDSYNESTQNRYIAH